MRERARSSPGNLINIPNIQTVSAKVQDRGELDTEAACDDLCLPLSTCLSTYTHLVAGTNKYQCYLIIQDILAAEMIQGEGRVSEKVDVQGTGFLSLKCLF